MRVLAIDTATRIASVVVADDGRVLAERTLQPAGGHAISLIPLIDELLIEAGLPLPDIDLLAVSIGPGSFTGLRIALSVAKGLALAASKPLVGVPTLTAVAHAAGPRSGAVWAVIDARKHEVYTACFAWANGVLEERSGPEVLRPEALASRLKASCLLAGDGVDAYRETFQGSCGDEIELLPASRMPPIAISIATLAVDRFRRGGRDDVAALEPAYFRASEAERKPRPGPEGSALVDGRG